MSQAYLNSLAEIQRECNKVFDNTDPVQWVNDINSLVEDFDPRKLAIVPHPSENFSILSDGNYYLVDDSGKLTLYKKR